MNEIPLQGILKSCVKLAKETGAFIKEQHLNSRDKVETKFLNNLVTYVDRSSEQRLVHGLSEIFPEAGFIVEEETVGRIVRDWQWVVDPLDGTTNFIYSVPSYAVSIALVYKDQPKLGVVYEVNRDECFWATEGNGAFLNGEQINVSKTDKLEEAFLSTGFPYYDFSILDEYNEFLKWLMPRTRGIRRLGAAAVDLCYVACGRYDAFFEHSLQAWDVAAGSLIIQEAGGMVNNFNGKDDFIWKKEIVATNKNLHKEFNKELQRYLKK